MPIPQRIRVLGRDFRVEATTQARENGLCGSSGYVNYIRACIGVDCSLTENRQREVVMHEVLHAAADAVAIELAEPDVCRLSRALFSVLQDSPGLAAYLVE